MGLEITSVEASANLKGFMCTRGWEGKHRSTDQVIFISE